MSNSEPRALLRRSSAGGQSEPRPSGSGLPGHRVLLLFRSLTVAARFSQTRADSRHATQRQAALVMLVALLGFTPSVRAEEPAPAPEPEIAVAQRSASQEVHEGNRLLLDGMPHEALEAYQRAAQERPDAPEIPFVKGLAHFALEEYDLAREEFLHASSAGDAALSDDALYGLGACDHAEALKLSDEPEQAIERLESAMQRYKSVLAGSPDHQAALDAVYKAGTLRRQLKQQMEQQQQESSGDDENEDNDQQENGEKNESDEHNKQDQSEQDSDQQDGEQQQSDADEQEQEDQQQQESSDPDENEQEESNSEEQAQAEQREQNSREQADRQLREMMQSLRERKRDRRKQVHPIPIAPVERDW